MTIQTLNARTTLNDLPTELLTRIFYFLDTKTLESLTTVSKKMKIIASIIGWDEIKHFTNNVVNRLPKQSFSIEIKWKHVENLKEIRTGIPPLKKKLVSELQKLNLATINSLSQEITPPFLIHNIFRLVLLETRVLKILAIQDQHQKNTGLFVICTDLIKENEIERAIEVAGSIGDEYDKSRTLLDIISALIQRNDIERAVEVVGSIGDEYRKFFAFKNLIKALIRREDIERVIEVAGSIGNEYHKSCVLRDVIKALIRREDIERAIEVAGSIGDKSQKSSALEDIKNVLIGAKDI